MEMMHGSHDSKKRFNHFSTREDVLPILEEHITNYHNILPEGVGYMKTYENHNDVGS